MTINEKIRLCMKLYGTSGKLMKKVGRIHDQAEKLVQEIKEADK